MHIGNPKDSVIINGTILFNKNERLLVTSKNKPVRLRSKTSDVLTLLVENNNQTVATDHFFETLWPGKVVSENVLKQSISEIRGHLQEDEKSIISTVPKQGYGLFTHVSTCTENKQKEERQKSGNLIKPLDKQKQKHRVTFKLKTYQSKIFYLGVTLFLTASAYLCFLITEKHNENVTLKNQISTLAYEKESLQNFFVKLTSMQNIPPENWRKALDAELFSLGDIKNDDPLWSIKIKSISDIYKLAGLYQESTLALRRVAKKIKGEQGSNSQDYIEIEFELIESLIQLRQTQQAFELANAALQKVELFHSDNKKLLAKAHYFAAQGNLFCTEPFCHRPTSMADGRSHALKALQIYQSQSEDFLVEQADALYMLNWFEHQAEEKLAIIERVIEIYKSELGFFHQKTAAAFEELSRIHNFFFENHALAEQSILAAYDIRKNLFTLSHPIIASTQYYLGQHYFMTRQFAKADQLLSSANKAYALTLGEGNTKNLRVLMLLARTRLYSERPQQAEEVINHAYSIVQRHKVVLPDSLKEALELTLLRINSLLPPQVIQPRKLPISLTFNNRNRVAESLFLHEQHIQDLSQNCQALSSEYRENIKQLVGYFNPKKYGHFYRVDLEFLKDRSERICEGSGALFGEQGLTLAHEHSF